MSEQTLKRLAAVAAVLVAVWGATTLWAGGGGDAPAVAAEAGDFFAGLDEASVDTVRFAGPDGALTLSRGADGWTVDGLRADSAMVAQFWTAVDVSEIDEVVARNPENHGRLGLREGEAHTLTFMEGGAERTLLIGSAGRGYGTTFVRLPGADEAYLLQGALRPHVTRDLEGWRDKRVVHVDTAAVGAIAVQAGDESYRVERADSAWQIDGGPASGQTVRDVLAELAGLRASGFLEATDSLAGLPQESVVTAVGTDGQVLAVVRLGAGEGDRWARTDGDETVYRVPQWRVERLAPAREDVIGS